MPRWRRCVIRGSAASGCAETGQQVGALAVAGDHVVLLEDVERRQCGAAGQRVAGVGVRVQEAAPDAVVVEGAVDRVGGEDDRQRQVAAGDAFRQAQEIRPDAGLLMGEEGAGAAAADGDLVADQMHL